MLALIKVEQNTVFRPQITAALQVLLPGTVHDRLVQRRYTFLVYNKNENGIHASLACKPTPTSEETISPKFMPSAACIFGSHPQNIPLGGEDVRTCRAVNQQRRHSS